MERRTLIKGAAAAGLSLLSGTGFAAAPKKKILVAYFSRARSISRGMDAITYATPWVGNTAEAARVIAQTLNADVHEIVTTEKYPLLHRENSRIAEQEMKSDARPGIAPSNLSLNSYSVVFLGFPIWWYREPMVIRTFLSRYQWKGKTIIPFCTSLEVDIPQARSDIMKLAPGAAVLEGRRFATENANLASEVKSWVQGLHL